MPTVVPALHLQRLWPTAALLVLPLAMAHAQTPKLTPQDVALLAGNCVTCHGPGGQPLPGSSMPALRGKGSAELLERMQALRAGQVAGATVMPLLMQGYDDAQMRALAQWFSQPQERKP